MTGLKEVLNDTAAEITPADPPVELTMLRGRRMRNRRRLAAIAGGAAGTIVLATGAAFGLPALAGHPGSTSNSASAPPADHAPLMRPVLLMAGPGAAAEHGNAGLVNAATLGLFRKLTCEPGPNRGTVDDQWKTALGYTAAQWNAPGSQVVSCDAHGDKYVLGKAVVLASQVTSAVPVRLTAGGQWVVSVTLDAPATRAVAQLTTSQSQKYYADASTNPDDAVLDQTAVVLNGDVLEAPQTVSPLASGKLMLQGPQPGGFTKAAAEAVAARL